MKIGNCHIGKYKYDEILEIFESIYNGINVDRVFEKFDEVPDKKKPKLWQAYVENQINYIGYLLEIDNIIIVIDNKKKIGKCEMEFYFEDNKLVNKEIRKLKD